MLSSGVYSLAFSLSLASGVPLHVRSPRSFPGRSKKNSLLYQRNSLSFMASPECRSPYLNH